MINRIKEVIAETFVLDDDQVSDSLTFGEIDEWDSMGHVHLIGALESEFGVTFTLNETEQLGSISGIAAVLKTKGIS